MLKGVLQVKADMELVIIHDGNQWVARNGIIEATGHTLPELDENVRRALVKSGNFDAGSKIMVLMGFDCDTFPTWIRQYAAYYFNRYVPMEL